MDNTFAVFGYKMLAADTVQTREPYCEVLAVRRCIDSGYPSDCNESESGDWALLELENIRIPKADPIQNIRVYERAWAEKSPPVFTIGHPFGLPAKLADNARAATDGDSSDYFTTSLDVFDGNSGSPVFHNDEIVGVVIERADNVHMAEHGTSRSPYGVKYQEANLSNYTGQRCMAITESLHTRIQKAKDDIGT